MVGKDVGLSQKFLLTEHRATVLINGLSRYTAHLEEQKEHDAQLQLQIETNAADSEAQAAAEPTAQILNSDAKFEDENDINKG